jgi:hypothetical protein
MIQRLITAQQVVTNPVKPPKVIFKTSKCLSITIGSYILYVACL